MKGYVFLKICMKAGRRKALEDSPERICSTCNRRTSSYNRSELGFKVYTNICGSCAYKKKKKRGTSLYFYQKLKIFMCERCNFIPEDSCQLDVDHIDGNHYNDSYDNLQTLCANCHRLKTVRQRNNLDWSYYRF